jgi:hypothetical protein
MPRRLPVLHTIKVSCPKTIKMRHSMEDTRISVAYQESYLELYWSERKVAAMSLHFFVKCIPCLPQHLGHTARQHHLEITNGCEAWSPRKRDIRETRNWNLLSAIRYIALTGISFWMFVIYWDWQKRCQHRSHEHRVTDIGIVFNVKLLLCSRT